MICGLSVTHRRVFLLVQCFKILTVSHLGICLPGFPGSTDDAQSRACIPVGGGGEYQVPLSPSFGLVLSFLLFARFCYLPAHGELTALVLEEVWA